MKLSRRQFTFGLAAGSTALTLPGCVSIPWMDDSGPVARPQPTPTTQPVVTETRIDAAEHPRLVQAFGGEYANLRLKGYVSEIGERLAAFAALRVQYRFTVLNSPATNAFALPDGNVYVTRGLLSLASNEAELASVLAHELGHINAGHAARRYASRRAGPVSGRALPPMFLDVPADALDLGAEGTAAAANLALRAHTSDEERQADRLAAGYMAAAGYAPEAMATFLAGLREQSALEARSLGLTDGAVDARNMMATHPRTPGQVRAAIAGSSDGNAADLALNRAGYLENINGMLFGTDPAQGIIAGRRFIHPGLRYQFDAPPGFAIRDARTRAVATDGGDRSLVVDVASSGGARGVRDYLVSQWGAGVKLRKVAQTSVHGAPAATAATSIRDNNGKLFEVRLIAIQRDARNVYRFMFFAPPSDNYDWEVETFRSTYSLKPVAADQAAGRGALRLRIERADGRSVADLARALPFGPRNDVWFRVLNRIAPGAEPPADATIKVFSI